MDPISACIRVHSGAFARRDFLVIATCVFGRCLERHSDPIDSTTRAATLEAAGVQCNRATIAAEHWASICDTISVLHAVRDRLLR